MHAKGRLFIGCLAGALVATLLPATAAAELVPGRPGRYESSSITIDATSGDCRATYESPAEGNLWMRGEQASVRVTTTPNWVHVTCRFTDISRLIEANAEVGHTDACTLVTEAKVFTGGRGTATSAANVSERADGGTSMVRCHFRSEPAPSAPGSAVAREPAGVTVPAGLAEVRERAKPAASPASSLKQESRGDRSTPRRHAAKAPKATAKTHGTSTIPDKATRAKGGPHTAKVDRGR